VNDEQMKQMLSLSLAAFERGDYDAALDRAKSAESILLISIKGNFLAYLRANWTWIVIIFAFIIITSLILYRYKAKTDLSERIKDLNKEETTIRERMAAAQSKYFSGKMANFDYAAIMKHDNERISKIEKERTNLRNQRIRILEPRKISSELADESQEVKTKIMALQEKYYRQRSINEDEYNSQYNILNTRLSEIFREKASLSEKGKKSHASKAPQNEKTEDSGYVKGMVNDGKETLVKISKYIGNAFSRVKNLLKKSDKDKRGIMIVDGKLLERLKEHTKHNNYKNKWIVMGARR
jgi:hypothetical protein